jgi:hypothetical protein
MRDRLLGFIGALRASGIDVSVTETLDAARAVGLVGVQRDALREALAACLVKDEADRLGFDGLFDLHFPLVSAGSGAKRARRRGAGAAAGGAGRGGSRTSGDGGTGGVRDPEVEAARGARPRDRDDALRAVTAAPRPGPAPGARRAREPRHGVAAGRRRRELLHKPFAEYAPLEVDEARDLVAALARQFRGRAGRRLRRTRRGRIDVRRTLRRATATGGVPVRLEHRGPRPRRPSLVALCDVSGSVAAVSEFLLGLVAPAAAFFRSVQTFVYIDHLCPATFERGRLVHDVHLDRHAFSDFGQVLREYCRDWLPRLDRNTVVVVLGDARNNRRPPHAALLGQVQARARAVLWLNPEPAARWDSGDSVMRQYGRYCTAVAECRDLGSMISALLRAL